MVTEWPCSRSMKGLSLITCEAFNVKNTNHCAVGCFTKIAGYSLDLFHKKNCVFFSTMAKDFFSHLDCFVIIFEFYKIMIP